MPEPGWTDSSPRAILVEHERPPMHASYAITPLPSLAADGDDAPRLTAAVARGDRDAFALLYSRWFGRMVASARRLTGRDEAFCLDVVQEAMLRAASRLPPLGSTPALARWLELTTHRAALDMLRQDRRRRARERGRGLAPLPDPDLDRRIAWVRERVRALAPRDRSLLADRFARGRSHAQIAADTHESPAAVEGRLRRLLKRLRPVPDPPAAPPPDPPEHQP